VSQGGHHPEGDPRTGLGATLREMINWCIQQPLEGQPLGLDDAKMVAIESYVAYERRGVEMVPGKH